MGRNPVTARIHRGRGVTTIRWDVHGAGLDAMDGSETRRRPSVGRALRWLFTVGLSALPIPFAPASHAGIPGWSFVDVTATAGVAYEHGYIGGPSNERLLFAGGVAAGDYDRDGFG